VSERSTVRVGADIGRCLRAAVNRVAAKGRIKDVVWLAGLPVISPLHVRNSA
jgi:hypothetical protein